MVRPFGRATRSALGLVLLPLALAGSGADTAPDRLVVAFVSPFPATNDPTFRAFAEAWTAKAKGRCQVARLQRIQAPSDRFDDLAAAALAAQRLQAVVLVAPTAEAARAARATSQVPLVFSSYLNPVRAGIISSEAPRPEAATGIALDDRLLSKRLSILQEAFAGIRSVGILVDQAWRIDSDLDNALAAERARTGLRFAVVAAEHAADVAAALRRLDEPRIDAWYIPPTYIAYQAKAEIIGHLRTSGRPSIHATLSDVKQGALMAYAQDTSFAFDALAHLASRVCNGEPAGSIPIERPRRFILSVQAQYDLGGTRLSPDVVAMANRVVE